jgi:hypothetical protein
MNDRELLEAAARAAGRKVFSYIDDPIFGSGINDGKTDNGLWNPLEDDGDALRLAVVLGLVIAPEDSNVDVYNSDGRCVTAAWDEHNGDKEKSTRRAIVCVAALIGNRL